MSETVKVLESLLTDQPKNPLRPNQVDEYREEQQRLQSIVKAPTWQTGADRGAASKRLRNIDKLIHDGAPKPLDMQRRDKVHKLTSELRQEIQSVMLPQSVMRRNPAGAVDAYRRGEGSKENKDKILLWKRAQRALDPENMDTDYTNIERFRPPGQGDGTATFMADAQIPGKFAMTPKAKDNWPLGEPTIDTPLKRARKELTPAAKKAARERLKKAREVKAIKAAHELLAKQPSVSQEVPV